MGLIVGLAVLLLIAGGYFGYRVIFPKPVPVVAVVRPVHPASARKPAPVPHPALLARKLSVANAAVKAESAELKAVMQTGASAAAKPAPAPSAPMAVVAAPPPVTEPAAPSPAFQAYVEGLIINGVFQGDPPRILVGGRLLRQGDVLDPTLGVVFVTVDPVNGRVIFKDRTGAIMTKRY